jgi:NAD(P)-dependent dehydrogenase (short-subunit alcohol dehydrogenase family)
MQVAEVFSPHVLEARVALITGAGSGIGLAISQRFAALGAKLVLVGRRAEPLELAKKAILDAGGVAVAAPADVRDFDSVGRAVQKAQDEFGGLDVLVNNAAGTFVSATEDITPNGWRTVVDIDLNGTFLCCKASFPLLKSSRFGGRIISIVTDKARTGWPGSAHAAAAKAGIISLSRTLAQEWGPHGIRTNTVAPGPIRGTEGVSRLYEQNGRAERELATIPAGHFGETSDIADACVFLASTAGNFVNGTDLVVDGGRAWHTPSSGEARR